jgi:hypothetical protein
MIEGHSDELWSAVIVAVVAVATAAAFLRAPRFRALAVAGAALALSALWVGPEAAPTGDAPHYEVLAHGIASGHLSVADAYREHAPADIQQDAHVSLVSDRATRYSKHLPGYPLLAAPLVGVLDQRALIVVSGLAMAAALLLARQLALDIGLPRTEASLATLGVLATPTVLGFARVGFSEALVAAGLAAAALRIVRNDRASLVAATVAAVLLPFTHLRGIVPMGLLLLAALLRSRAARDTVPLVGLAVGVLGVLALFQYQYGTWAPDAPYAGTADGSTLPTARSLLGLLVDGHAGLLFAAPLAAASLLMLGSSWRSSRWATAGIAGALASTYLVGATWKAWDLGHSPMGRLWAPVVPLLVPLVAMLLQRSRPLFAVLLAGGAVAAGAVVVVPYGGFPGEAGIADLLERVPGAVRLVNLSPLPGHPASALAWAVAVGAVFVGACALLLRPARST